MNGILKTQFRCFLRLNHHVKAAHIIYLCVAMHNIALHVKTLFQKDVDPEKNDNLNPDELQNVSLKNWLNEGERLRRNFVINFFNKN